MKYNNKQELLFNQNAIATSIVSNHKKIIFIDSQVEDYQDLANGVLPGIETVILDSQDNGIEQITSVLSQNSNITSIHIVSHGAPGSLYLGNTSLSLDTLSVYQEQLKTWFNSSSVDQEGQRHLSLYGCHVAAGDAGEEFITKLYKLTGAEIAASTTAIGNATKGGNWELNRTTSNQTIELAFNSHTQASYAGIFADGDDINQDLFDELVQEIMGTDFNDRLYGTENSDYMDGKAGNDVIFSSLGADALIGGAGRDYVLYRHSQDAVSLDLSTNTATGGDAEGDTFDSIEIIYGSRFNDVLIGDDNKNKFYGVNGDDMIIGHGGNDYLHGQNGHDSVEGGAGKDTLLGGSGDDILTGADVMTNGVGEIDRLKGNRGADIFVLGTDSTAFYDDGENTSNGLTDYALILDFNSREDVIQLSGEETYYLDANPSGTLFGTGVYIDNDGTAGFSSEDELVGLIRSYSLTPGMINDSTVGFEMV